MLVVVFRDEYYSREVDSIGARVSVGAVPIRVSLTRRTAADIRSEENGGEEDQETEGYGNGVAKAEISQVIGRTGGGGDG